MRRKRGVNVAIGALWFGAMIAGFAWLQRSTPEAAVRENATSGARRTSTRHDEYRTVEVPVRTASAVVRRGQLHIRGRVRSGALAVPAASLCWVPLPMDNPVFDDCTSSDQTGAFVLEASGDGRGHLTASAAGYLSKRLPLGEPLERSEVLDIELAPGGDWIRGEVVDPTGGNVVGALVTANSGDGSGWATAISDARGSFQLSVPTGPVELRVEADEYCNVVQKGQSPAADVRLVLTPASVIAGRVQSAHDGEGIPNVVVTAYDHHGLGISQPRPIRSGPDGKFEIEDVGAGAYDLVATASEWRSHRQMVGVGLAERVEGIVLEVEPAASLRATVTLNEEPCTQGTITVSGQTVSLSTPVRDGEGVAEGLLPGRYLVAVSCSSNGSVNAGHFELQPASDLGAVGGEEFVNVDDIPIERHWALTRPKDQNQRRSGGSIHAVIDAAHRPLAQWVVSAVSTHDQEAAVGRRDGDDWQFNDLALGAYDVYVKGTPGPYQRVRLTRPGEQLEVKLVVPPQASIVGQVLDASGVPVPDVWVRAYVLNTATGFVGTPALTDASGSFAIEQLFEGTYGLVIRGVDGVTHSAGVDTGSDVRLVFDPRAGNRTNARFP